MKASMHQAKTSLSRLVEHALAGEEVILTRGKSHMPVARIIPIQPQAVTLALRERPIGLYAAEMGSGPDWVEPMPEEELAVWENPSLLSDLATSESAASPSDNRE